jgi:hypothetical protein
MKEREKSFFPIVSNNIQVSFFVQLTMTFFIDLSYKTFFYVTYTPGACTLKLFTAVIVALM